MYALTVTIQKLPTKYILNYDYLQININTELMITYSKFLINTITLYSFFLYKTMSLAQFNHLSKKTQGKA